MKIDMAARDLVYAILSAGNALLREAGRLFKAHGITAVQFNVLSLLADAPDGLRPSEVTAALVVDASSTTYLVDRMEELGWLRRVDDKADRRAWRIVLTPAGRKLHADIAPIYLAALREVLNGINVGQVAWLCDVLNNIPGAARRAVDTALAPVAKAPRSKRIKR